jgi:hypothetical protein
MNANEKFAKLAEIPYYHVISYPTWAGKYSCSCGKEFVASDKAALHVVKFSYPSDFTDAREVLKVMMVRNDWSLFQLWIWSKTKATLDNLYMLVTDTTGKLRDLAIEWMEERK